MIAFTSTTPLKVLTPTLADRLRVFNQAARALQQQGFRLLRFDPSENCLTVSPEVGAQLLTSRQVIGYKRHPTAGSTRFFCEFQGVTLEWQIPISYAHPEEWAKPTIQQGTLQ